MELALLVYGISVVHSLGFVLVLALVFSVIVFIGSGIGYIETYSDKGKVIALRWLKGVVITLAIVVPLSIIIPSEKTMYMMVGAYAAQKVAEDPNVQQLSGKVLKLVETKLDAYIDEAAETPKKVTK